MRHLPLFLAGALALTSACAQPEPAASDVPLPELAATAEPIAEPGPAGDVASPTAAAAAPPSPVASVASPEPTGSTTASPAPTTAGGTASPAAASLPDGDRELLAATDPSGDAGLEGPRWADLVGLRLVDTGADLAVTVELAGAPPARLEDGEVVGVGIDLYPPGAGESASQLFVDGGSDGWRAYLQTRDGFVGYPGEFRIEGARLELTVPWPAVEGPTEAEVGAFLDWSRRAVVTNLVASDRVPDRGRARFER